MLNLTWDRLSDDEVDDDDGEDGLRDDVNVDEGMVAEPGEHSGRTGLEYYPCVHLEDVVAGLGFLNWDTLPEGVNAFRILRLVSEWSLAFAIPVRT
jgi:hypothetical protein